MCIHRFQIHLQENRFSDKKSKQTMICGVIFTDFWTAWGSAKLSCKRSLVTTISRNGRRVIDRKRLRSKLFNLFGKLSFQPKPLVSKLQTDQFTLQVSLILSHPTLTWPPSPYFHFPVVEDSDLVLQSCCLSASAPRSVTDYWHPELPPLQPTYERESNGSKKTAQTICYCWRRMRAITNPFGKVI